MEQNMPYKPFRLNVVNIWGKTQKYPEMLKKFIKNIRTSLKL
jgi:hypothetical protein